MSIILQLRCGGRVVHWLERLSYKQKVEGPIPSTPTKWPRPLY